MEARYNRHTLKTLRRGIMKAPRIVREEFKTIPREGLASAIENLKDRLALQRASDEEVFPDDVLKRLLSGENPIRVFRMHKGIKQSELANTCGISKGYLSLIEKGEKEATVSVYRKLADALNLEIEDLI